MVKKLNFFKLFNLNVFYFFLFQILIVIFFQNCGQDGFRVTSAPLDNSSLGDSSDPFSADPLTRLAWHINNVGQKVFATQAGKSGFDLNLRKTWEKKIFGKGIRILVSDDGIDTAHEDLKDNLLVDRTFRDYYVSGWSANTTTLKDDDFHGTSVTGLIAAVGWNGRGGIGVAPYAKVAGTNFVSSQVEKTVEIIADQAKGDVDIVNMSWGYPQSAYVPIEPALEDQFKYGVENGRFGLGKIYIRSAGNSRIELLPTPIDDYRIGTSSFDGNNITPYTINVGAMTADGENAFYSSPGANLWLSAPGGDDGEDFPAMVTADRTGCDFGAANKSVSDSVAKIGNGFEKGLNGNSGCNYTVTFNGTSSAAPVVSGAVALLLESKPGLSWRDVKYILAKTAKVISPDENQSENYLYLKDSKRFANQRSPAGYKWDDGWSKNTAGFNFNNLFGFGKIDVDAAVEFASNYVTQFNKPMTQVIYDYQNLNLNIPDFDANGVIHQANVTKNIIIEAIQVVPTISHPNAAELAIELISPSDERSVLVPMNNSLEGKSGINGYVFLTNKFYQESSFGNWKIKVVDGRTGNTGALTRWKLIFYGQEN